MLGHVTPQSVCLLYRNIHTGPRQGKEPGPIVSYCAGPVACTCPDAVPKQCQ